LQFYTISREGTPDFYFAALRDPRSQKSTRWGATNGWEEGVTGSPNFWNMAAASFHNERTGDEPWWLHNNNAKQKHYCSV